jgi:hypothetical protein
MNKILKYIFIFIIAFILIFIIYLNNAKNNVCGIFLPTSLHTNNINIIEPLFVDNNEINKNILIYEKYGLIRCCVNVNIWTNDIISLNTNKLFLYIKNKAYNSNANIIVIKKLEYNCKQNINNIYMEATIFNMHSILE